VNRDIEAQRIIAEYDRRDRILPADYYGLHHLPNLFNHHEHERKLVRALHRVRRFPLAERRIVEVGCGEGDWLRFFERIGARQENLSGIDLGEGRIEIAKRRLPAADVRAGDATKLPWPDASFDIALQRMMFTSILDADARKAAAAEMMRVVRPDGLILWIDFFVNPNPQVRALGRRDVRALFPGWRPTFYRTTLAPPLARRIVPISWTLGRVIESLRVFNSFYLAVLEKDR
jgi:ubiquinone/menaquinone biosynthesis C-methylase UbiE